MGGRVAVDGVLGGSGVLSFVIGEAFEIVLTGSESSLALLEVSLESLELIGCHGDREEGRSGAEVVGDWRSEEESRVLGFLERGGPIGH
jgi:hypothetical protein